ncbi:hypothetical protein GQ600_24269 [Phytophthora cactorum]|nr:hypothetical protein GQ600_24269 [Phytophthora cactorum]
MLSAITYLMVPLPRPGETVTLHDYVKVMLLSAVARLDSASSSSAVCSGGDGHCLLKASWQRQLCSLASRSSHWGGGAIGILLVLLATTMSCWSGGNGKPQALCGKTHRLSFMARLCSVTSPPSPGDVNLFYSFVAIAVAHFQFRQGTHTSRAPKGSLLFSAVVWRNGRSAGQHEDYERPPVRRQRTRSRTEQDKVINFIVLLIETEIEESVFGTKSITKFWNNGYVIGERVLSQSICDDALRELRDLTTILYFAKSSQRRWTVFGYRLSSNRWGMRAKILISAYVRYEVDYPTLEIAKALIKKDLVQTSVIVALEDNKLFHMYPGCFGGKVECSQRMTFGVDKKEIFLFCGDLAHSGAKFETQNIRLQCFVCVKEFCAKQIRQK